MTEEATTETQTETPTETPAEAPVDLTPEQPATEPSLFGDAGDAPADTDTEETNGLILGKFKDQEALEKSYTELETKMKEGRGITPEITEENPFGYSYEDTFKNAGIQPHPITNEDGSENTQNKEDYDAFFGRLSEAGFTQDQFEIIVDIGGKWAQDQMAAFSAEHGPQVDLEAEGKKLPQIFGNDWKKQTAAIGKWAATNLPPEIYTKPLHQTAVGMQLLNNIRNSQNQKINPITDNASQLPEVDMAQLDKDIAEGIKEYRGQVAKGKSNAESKVDELIKKRAEAEARQNA